MRKEGKVIQSQPTDNLLTMHQHHMRKVQRALDEWGQDCLMYKVNPIDGIVATQLGGRVTLNWECNLNNGLKRVSCKHCGQFIEPDQTCPELDGYKACEPEEAQREVRL